METVELVINPKTGDFEIEINGVQGGKCTDITNALMRNHEVDEQQLTAEYHEEEELPDYVHTPEVE